MQERASQVLYQYWNRLRRGRGAPNRCEIEPKQIAALLPETLIIECDARGYRFRLAGTRICQQFQRELKNADFVDLWADGEDRKSILGSMRSIMEEASVAYGRFHVLDWDGRRADFEISLLPLIHDGVLINRMLGAITALNPPWWLGQASLSSLVLEWICTVAPGTRDVPFPPVSPMGRIRGADNVVALNPRHRRFRVLNGGRIGPSA